MSQFQGQEVASAYDQWSRTYETVENATRDLAAAVLRQQSLNLRDRVILEIGCGTGLNTRYLVRRSREVIAIDFSAGMLEQARANVSAPNVRFVQCDIRLDWPVADASVDLIVCMLVLEHIPNLDFIFHQAARVLRPGGEFFVAELHPFKQLQGTQARFTEADSGNLIFVQAFHHDVSEFVNASIQNGFRLIRLDEWRSEKEETKATPPRLLSLHVGLWIGNETNK